MTFTVVEGKHRSKKNALSQLDLIVERTVSPHEYPFYPIQVFSSGQLARIGSYSLIISSREYQAFFIPMSMWGEGQ